MFIPIPLFDSPTQFPFTHLTKRQFEQLKKMLKKMDKDEQKREKWLSTFLKKAAKKGPQKEWKTKKGLKHGK